MPVSRRLVNVIVALVISAGLVAGAGYIYRQRLADQAGIAASMEMIEAIRAGERIAAEWGAEVGRVRNQPDANFDTLKGYIPSARRPARGHHRRARPDGGAAERDPERDTGLLEPPSGEAGVDRTFQDRLCRGPQQPGLPPQRSGRRPGPAHERPRGRTNRGRGHHAADVRGAGAVPQDTRPWLEHAHRPHPRRARGDQRRHARSGEGEGDRSPRRGPARSLRTRRGPFREGDFEPEDQECRRCPPLPDRHS